MSALFEQTMKALAGKLSAVKVPMWVKVTIDGQSAYLDAQAGSWLAERSPGWRVEAMLDGSVHTFAQILSGGEPIRRAFERHALTFAGDLSLLPLFERAISGVPPKTEPSGGLEYVSGAPLSR